MQDSHRPTLLMLPVSTEKNIKRRATDYDGLAQGLLPNLFIKIQIKMLNLLFWRV